MDFLETIKQSEKRLNKLRIITNFFENSDIVGISIRTKVIHDIFNANAARDFSRLELFHLQFTDTFLDLMQKLKKKNEQKYLIYQNEININNEFIFSYKTEIKNDRFREDCIIHNQQLNSFFENIYQILAFDKKEVVHRNFLNDFCSKYAETHFRNISNNDFSNFDCLKPEQNHEYQGLLIEKKLIGKMNIARFKSKFICGFKFNENYFMVYEFIHANIHFVYNFKKQLFALCNFDDFANTNFSKNTSNKQALINELNEKTNELTKQSTLQLKVIPDEVQSVIKEYHQKISSISFLDDLQKIDEQTNVLRSMLNLKIN